MLTSPAYLLLTIYSAIIVVTYFVVRQGWVRAYPVFVVGGTLNALVVFAFSLLRGNMLLQAVLVGPLAGYLFVALSVMIARVYRDTAPSKVAKPSLIIKQDSESLPLEHAHSSAA